MGGLSTTIFPEPIRSFNSAAFSGSYQAIGAPLAHAARIVKFTNLSNVTVTLSWDGVHDHEVLPANSFVLIDITTAHSNSLILEVAQGTQFFVKGSAGSGNFYISCYYGA